MVRTPVGCDEGEVDDQRESFYRCVIGLFFFHPTYLLNDG